MTFYPIFDNKTKNIYEDRACYDESLDKIELKLIASGIVYVMLGDCGSVYSNSEQFIIEPYSLTKIGFTSYSIIRSSTPQMRCLEGYHVNYSFERCVKNCYIFRSNKSYGCVKNPGYHLYTFHISHETFLNLVQKYPLIPPLRFFTGKFFQRGATPYLHC